MQGLHRPELLPDAERASFVGGLSERLPRFAMAVYFLSSSFTGALVAFPTYAYWMFFMYCLATRRTSPGETFRSTSP